MSTRGIKIGAVLLLAAAIAALVGAFIASDRAVRIQGPGALVVGADREVWIGVDDALWRVSPDGRLLARIDIAATSLPGPPANLVRHPGGAIVATVRDDPTLYFLDAAQARVTRRVLPRWPAELARHGGRAINLAFHPDGRVAIATGGGHAVALFDADGGFIARSAPDTYKFSNGLWWQGEALWTTDTNRFRLKRLDGRTLALREERALPANGAGSYLGPARAQPGSGGSTAALIRYRNGMIHGHIVAVATQGTAPHDAEFAHAGALEPRDVDWLGDELLASDGASLSVLRWSAEHAALGVFGDTELRERWAALSAARAQWQQRYRIGLGLAIATFAVAFALALWAELRERNARRTRAPIDLSRLGTPQLSQRALITLSLRANGWAIGFALPLALLQFTPLLAALRALGGLRLTLAVLVTLALATLAGMVFLLRRLHRLARDPAYEPMFNALALRKLGASDALGLALRDGEQVLETFIWQRPSLHWAVLTDERLLVFAATLLDHRLQSQHALDELVAVSVERGALTPGRLPRFAALLRGGPAGWLEIALRNGEVLGGAVTAPTVAERVTRHLLRRPGIAAQRARAAARPRLPAGAKSAAPSARAAAWASALIPGLGQWMQRRRATALLMFVPWALAVATVFVPVAWTLYGPRAEVAPTTIAFALGLALIDAAVAAWDAWRMGPQRAR